MTEIVIAAALTTTLTFPNETRRAVLLLQLHLLLLYIKIKIKLMQLRLCYFTPQNVHKRHKLIFNLMMYSAARTKITEALNGR